MNFYEYFLNFWHVFINYINLLIYSYTILIIRGVSYINKPLAMIEIISKIQHLLRLVNVVQNCNNYNISLHKKYYKIIKDQNVHDCETDKDDAWNKGRHSLLKINYTI